MHLQYNNKVNKERILDISEVIPLEPTNKNLLLGGDNLLALRKLLKSGYAGKVDLVYIDPPFSTKKIFKTSSNRTRTISSSDNDIIAYSDNLTGEEYLEFLRQRLILIRELLSEQGSIYLHIDYKIGHYVKIIMDEVFGINNFRNDITRIKCNPKNFNRRAYGNIKDLILFYSKTKNIIWNSPVEAICEKDKLNRFKKISKNGRRYTTIPIHAPGETKNGDTGKPWREIPPPPGRHWRISPEELDRLDKEGLIEWSKTGNPRKIVFSEEVISKKKQDIWSFKDSPYPSYPTEKNIDMLKFIIEASSNIDSIVLDCFCGGGNTLCAAQVLNRRWIGIDSSVQAINITLTKITNLTRNKTLFENNTDFVFISL